MPYAEKNLEVLVNENITLLTSLTPVLNPQTESPYVSLYLPTRARTTQGDDENRIMFKDVVADANEQLAATFKAHAYENITTSLDDITANLEDIIGPASDGGLAVFADASGAYFCRLGYHVEPRAVVGTTYFIRPLLHAFVYGSHYYLLGLSTDRFAFIKGDCCSLRRLSMPADVHDEFSELFAAYDGTEVALDYEALEGHLSPFHGWKSRNDVKKEEAEKFFYYVDKAVNAHWAKESSLPIILVSLPEHQTMFRKLSIVPTLLDRGIEEAVETLSEEDLLERAATILDEARDIHVRKLIDIYGDAQAHDTASGDIDAIGLALAERKVRVLFVAEDKDMPGLFDETTGKVIRVAREEHGLHGDAESSDILDAFAQAALRQDAEVYVLPSGEIPSVTGAAALFRY